MRILIDLQACQGRHGKRGIGRYVLGLVRGLAAAAQGRHELWLLLHAQLQVSPLEIRELMAGLVPAQRIVVFEQPDAFAEMEAKQRRIAAALRDDVISGIGPDVMLIGSLFEGFDDAAVVDVGSSPIPSAAVVFDLIPYLYPQEYLTSDAMRTWYFRQLGELRRADLLLAISDYTRRMAVEHLNWPTERIVSIYGAVNGNFSDNLPDSADIKDCCSRHGLTRPYLMYTSGDDSRKNTEGLIHAFAKLPANLRRDYHLAVVCALGAPTVRKLRGLADSLGLDDTDVIMTGHVSDADLKTLYAGCHLFVFPSLLEGLGLPVLEAMTCHAPVIGARATSLPEIIDHNEALFDPHNIDDMATLIARSLSDDDFRQTLRTNARQQAARYSWDRSAKLALAALEQLAPKRQPRAKPPLRRPRLAYVSPQPPEQTGIAAYSAELLPHLARYYDIELIVDQPNVADQYLTANFPVRDSAWFAIHAERYDRILYQIGNSGYHKHMFALLKRHPGVVTLHDFYLGNLMHWMEATRYSKNAFRHALGNSHGYGALAARHTTPEADLAWEYPCNLQVLQDARAVIVHSSYAAQQAERWYGPVLAGTMRSLPQPRLLPANRERQAIRQRLGYRQNDILVCSFGMLTRHKQNHRLLDAWRRAGLYLRTDCHLVFVGELPQGCYADELRAWFTPNTGGVSVTGFVDENLYSEYLCAADIAVQLRSRTRGETSRAVLDCLAHGLPLIINANGPMAEFPDHALVKLTDDFSDDELTAALQKLCNDKALRSRLAATGPDYIGKHHHPAVIAEQYCETIEHHYRNGRHARYRLLMDRLGAVLQKNQPQSRRSALITATATTIAANRRGSAQPRPCALYLDVSELVERDAKSGIQRVVRKLLEELPAIVPGRRLAMVCCREGRYFELSPETACGLLQVEGKATRRRPRKSEADSEPLMPGAGDIFLGLDLVPHQVPQAAQTFDCWRRRGVHVAFVVYDLMPIMYPHYFVSGAHTLFHTWLTAASHNADQLLCISHTVERNLQNWLRENLPAQAVAPQTGFFHLGADFTRRQDTGSQAVTAAPTNTAANAQPGELPVFLMVGTIEPRKGHAQVFDAFNELWEAGINVKLEIVGKSGWLVDKLIRQIRSHREFGQRLIWREQPSDNQLDQLYRNSTALLAASYDEGFGLPLIEAAGYNLPVIARDIPVFREVAGTHASYFTAENGHQLAAQLRNWLTCRQQNSLPSSAAMPRLSWRQSAEQLFRALQEGKLPATTDELM